MSDAFGTEFEIVGEIPACLTTASLLPRGH